MSIRANLLSEIQIALGLAIAPNLTSHSHGNDLYEAYVWSIVVAAAKAEGAHVSYYDVHGTPVYRRFHFRTSPGNIFSSTHPYSHALLEFNDCPALEAHVGVYVT